MLTSSSFYNTIAHEYESYCNASLVNTFIEDDVALVENYKPKSILEFGIGDGRFARIYIQRNPNVEYIGVDNSKDMLRYAQDSKAILILEDFSNYVIYAISKKMWFDCIIAPYTAIHHIETGEQLDLFENMKLLTNVIIINCVTAKKEKEIFTHSNETEITFMLPNGNGVKTRAHKLHETIRKNMQKKSEGGDRENLVWENR